jgi:hypothetical protein
MSRATLRAMSSEVQSIDVKRLTGAYLSIPTDYLNFDFDGNEFTVWLDPHDLARIAGMLRSASEAIEALVEPKVKPALRLVQSELQAA